MTASPRASSSAGASSGRVLAIDYGQRRLGLAISDPVALTARPLGTLERKNRRADLRRLRELIRENGVRRLVVGHPVHLDGSASEMAGEAVRFAKRMEKQLGLPVELVDERLSSWEAGGVVAAQGRAGKSRSAKAAPPGARRKKVHQTLDAVAAAVILRDYLEREHALSAAARQESARRGSQSSDEAAGKK